jgi:dGTPase
MIAYIGKDRQDLFKAKLTLEQDFSQNGILGIKNANIVSRLITNVIKCSLGKPYISMDDDVYKNLDILRSENNKIYEHDDVVGSYEQIVKPMMEKMYVKLLSDLENREFDSPIFQFYLNDTIQGNCYRDTNSRKIICDPNDAVTDYIASMTDDYFIELFNYMKIDDNLYNKIQYKSYFE